MSVALYRRYRPETFADVIGQEHVTEPLMQALRTGRVNHAYLFSGPRGCGKTTSARILARCLNCEQGPTPTPCGTCDSCVALARGGPGTVDVIEIDAASHGGVDDARDLRERASYGPAQSRYKIYIIDEAHMVTSAGFNALLKIVEEPPEHVKFVFATTEPEKVIGTIRSRTHHYPFRLVPPGQLTDYMERLCAQEGVSVEPGVLSFVVRAGGGSVRDSLSVLDQLIAGSSDAGLTYESAAALLGFTDAELLDATVEAMGAGDAAGLFRAIDRVIESGLDPRRFCEDLLERLRDLIVVQAVPDGAAAVLRAVPADQLERMRAQAAAFGAGALSRAADVVFAGLSEMTGATAPRLQLELIAARVLLPGAAGEGGYAARLDRLERRLDVGGVPTSAAPLTPLTTEAPVASRATAPVASASSVAMGAPHADARAPDPVASAGSVAMGAPDADASGGAASAPSPSKGPGGLDAAAIRRAWPDVLAKIFETSRGTWTFVSQNAQVLDYDGERLVLGTATGGLLNAFRSGGRTEHVRQALIDVLGVDVRIEAVAMDGTGEGGAPATRVAPILAPTVTAEPPAPPAPPAATAPHPRRQPQTPPRHRPAAPANASNGEGPTWSRAPGDQGTAPSWATADPEPPPEEPEPPEDDELTPLERARVEAARTPDPETHVADDSAVSADDEDIEALGEVGIPVVERILGGTIIKDELS